MRISTTFAAVCTLMTASAALAADITIYGIVNTGLSYTSAEKIEGKTTRSLAMDSGNYLGSRFGIKGEEDLGGVHVGFVLENGFSSDTGTLSDGGRFFGREASLYVQSSDYGTLRASHRDDRFDGNLGTDGREILGHEHGVGRRLGAQRGLCRHFRSNGQHDHVFDAAFCRSSAARAVFLGH